MAFKHRRCACCGRWRKDAHPRGSYGIVFAKGTRLCKPCYVTLFLDAYA